MKVRAGTLINIEQGCVIVFENMIGLAGLPNEPMKELFSGNVRALPKWAEVEVLGEEGVWCILKSNEKINFGTAGSVDNIWRGLIFRVEKERVYKWAETSEVSHKDDREQSAKEIDNLRAKYC